MIKVSSGEAPKGCTNSLDNITEDMFNSLKIFYGFDQCKRSFFIFDSIEKRCL